MALENQLTVIGNLTDDPRVGYTNDGTPYASVTVAVNRRVRDRATGEWSDQLDGFFDGTLWRDVAQNVAASLKKGDRVIMIGRLVKRSYQAKDGTTRQAIEVQIDEIAPSLKWAIASVTRNSANRQGGGFQPSASGAPRQEEPLAPLQPPTEDVPF